jgi:hypothetical protein
MVTKGGPVISGTWFLVVFLVMMELSATMGFARKASVDIYNYVEGQEIQVTCEVFGEKTLRYGEHFGWGFTPSIWGDTYKSCGFKWGTRIQHFVVWASDEIISRVPFRPCVNCRWDVVWEGFYLHECGDKRSCFFYSWFGPSRFSLSWFSSWFGHH